MQPYATITVVTTGCVCVCESRCWRSGRVAVVMQPYATITVVTTGCVCVSLGAGGAGEWQW